MPLFRVALATSLDGYICTTDGSVEWLNPYFTPELDFGAFVAGIGITVLGRNTYDRAVAAGHVDATAEDRSVVLTHRPIDGLPPGAEAYAGELPALARRLRAELEVPGKLHGKDIWLMGGSECIRSFDDADLVDRWELSIMPVRLGAGVPLFPRRDAAARPLRLTHHRILGNGIVEIWYEPVRDAST